MDEEQKNQAEEYLNNWKRERADFINYRKDETKRMQEFIKFANEGLIMEMIDILDDLEIVVKHQSEKDGLKQILNKFMELLKKNGIEKIKVTDQNFDPLYHESVESEPDGDKIEEVRAGYTMNDKVVRPARVKIVKK